jgi:predicted phosphodiesterase
MRILICSDIHANLAAFQAVLNAAGYVDKMLCTGDIVGFGPDPAECVKIIRQRSVETILGNHDLQALKYNPGKTDNSDNNERWLGWTKKQLSSVEIEYLRNLPKILEGVNHGIPYRLVHWAPEYASYEKGIEGEKVHEYQITNPELRILFFGHCHRPGIKLVNKDLLIVSAGSVGQPRDGDWRASFVIWEDERIVIHRTSYDIEQTVENLERVPITGSYRKLWKEILRNGRLDMEKIKLHQ